MRYSGKQDAEGVILVADDDSAHRRILTRMLNSKGFDVREAQSGSAALDILNREHIDVALLDVMMPGQDGYEICRSIRQDHHHVHLPVLFISVNGGRDARLEGFRAGGDGYLVKPVDEIELIWRVHHFVQKRRELYHFEQERASLKRTVEEQSDLLGKAMVEIGRAKKTLRKFNEEIIFRLSRAVEFRDDETGNHVQRMSRFCGLIASKMGMSKEMAEAVRIASALHDVGKIAIPDEILRKPSRLSPEELAIMRQHAEKGYRVLAGSDSSLLELAATIALSHHERFDGSGYPRKLKGKEIPFEGRIAAVADVFDALTSKRVYKPAFSIDDAKDIMIRESSTGFDPQIVEAFLEETDDIKNIMIVYADR